MSKKLAIKGHSTRGQEVIEILEMLGGVNSDETYGDLPNNWDVSYYIFKDGVISVSEDKILIKNQFVIFTLEEFLTQYPYKVGELKDLVDDHISCVITEMRWNELDECVEYHAEFGSNDYGWYRAYEFCSDYQIEEHNTVISGINLNSCDYADEVELNLGNYEIEVRDGKTYAVKKKPKYPTTYKECCDVLLIPPYYNLRYHTYERGYNEYATSNELLALQDKLNTLGKLIICRNAYWKIAGEEMGLDGPWKPDYTDLNNITYYGLYNELRYSIINPSQFVFPTVEMRDAFYKNFKDLIEQCK